MTLSVPLVLVGLLLYVVVLAVAFALLYAHGEREQDLDREIRAHRAALNDDEEDTAAPTGDDPRRSSRRP